MKLSELWLRELVNISLDSETLLNQITMMGLEVNDVEPVAGEFYGVVTGEVVECCQHPRADNLQVIKVNIGRKHLLNIVCRELNYHHGLKVAVAPVGAVLPNNFKVKVEEIHNELSEGKLCSYYELGILNNCNNTIELPADVPIGINIRDYLKLDDNIIEISVTPNRADCLSIIGIARDIAVINKTELNIPHIAPVSSTISDTLPIQVEANDVCPRYLSRIVKNININTLTPLWMKEKLRRCGISSSNIVTDISNYVLLEFGQPIHIFDKDYIDGGIIVRMAKEGETLVIAGGDEVTLHVDTLVIADYSKVLAIGGILDGIHSNINYTTQNLLIKCVFFSPLYITNCVRRYGLNTNSSYRYERGVDPELQYKAIERITSLLINICGGEAGSVIDITNKLALPRQSIIILSRVKLDKLVGCHIDDMQVSDILFRLGCKVTKDHGQWKVLAPSWRFDIKIEEDLIEEIIRIYGYNNVPNKPVQTDLVVRNHCEADISLKRIKIMLNDKGYQEVITYSFVNPKMQKMIHPGTDALILLNPISNEMSVMRLSLWTGLLGTIIYNQNRQQSRMRIFETGFCFIPDAKANLGIRQDLMLAGAICGNLYEEHWSLTKKSVDFYDLKGDLESVFDLTGKLSEIKFRAESIPALHPGQRAAIYLKEERIGSIGVIHPELKQKLNLNFRTIVFELDWNKITGLALSQVHKISHFPATRRDISIIVAENVPVADILAECKKVSINQIVDVNLFDVYRGKGIAEGYKSLAISIILQDKNRTLKEDEIARIISKCIEILKERFQASLRN